MGSAGSRHVVTGRLAPISSSRHPGTPAPSGELAPTRTVWTRPSLRRCGWSHWRHPEQAGAGFGNSCSASRGRPTVIGDGVQDVGAAVCSPRGAAVHAAAGRSPASSWRLSPRHAGNHGSAAVSVKPFRRSGASAGRSHSANPLSRGEAGLGRAGTRGQDSRLSHPGRLGASAIRDFSGRR